MTLLLIPMTAIAVLTLWLMTGFYWAFLVDRYSVKEVATGTMMSISVALALPAAMLNDLYDERFQVIATVITLLVLVALSLLLDSLLSVALECVSIPPACSPHLSSSNQPDLEPIDPPGTYAR